MYTGRIGTYKEFITKYEKEYSDKNPDNVENYITNKLDQGILDKYVVAWKASRLVATCKKGPILSDEDLDLSKFEDSDSYKNGYGRKINKQLLDKYLEDLNNVDVEKELDGFENFEFNHKVACFSNLYGTFLEKMPMDKKGKKLPNFGTVYVINLIYFASKGILPIYDQFAHKAVKALYADVSPSDIYVGEAPEKKNEKAVTALYREYLWLLDKVFGDTSISRNVDQALWAYGHAKSKYNI